MRISRVHAVYILLRGCRQTPTILQGGSDDFLGRWAGPRAVTGLHHQPVLGKLVEVVQGVNLAVPRGVYADDVELEVTACAVLTVTDLVATDNPILQVFFGSLEERREMISPAPGEARPMQSIFFLGGST